MPLDPELVRDCLYDESGIFFDEVLAIDRERSVVRLRMPTHDDLPLTRSQRADPERHPRHVSGGLMVHMSAMVGFAHAFYCLGVRSADGWVGYGAIIHRARYPNLARIGPPLELEGRAVHVKRGASRLVVRYAFLFEQSGVPVYEGDQTAVWSRR
ncbi:MAG TPA: hypothetical protein VFU21_23920 [Kofleriaceae bacterium]|nr:hypothetical protein [Kofleriaceae bacterium]